MSIKAAYMKKAIFELSLERYIGYEKQDNNILSLMRPREPDKGVNESGTRKAQGRQFAWSGWSGELWRL